MRSEKNCPTCQITVSSKHFQRHCRTCVPGKRICATKLRSKCGINFTIDNFKRHQLTCKSTGTSLPQPSKRKVEVTSLDASPPTKRVKLTKKADRFAFEHLLEDFNITSDSFCDVRSFLESERAKIISILNDALTTHSTKFYAVLCCKYKKPSDEIYKFFHATKAKTLHQTDVTNLDSIYDKFVEELVAKHEEHQAEGSGGSLCGDPHELCLTLSKFLPLAGSSYIALPPEVEARKAVLNIQNKDTKCFLWSVLAALHPIPRENNPRRVAHYKQYELELEDAMAGIAYPVEVSHIRKFEVRARDLLGLQLAINVYGLTENENEVHPIRVSNVSNNNEVREINLLLIKDETHHHYTLIRSLSRLVSSQRSKDKTHVEVCRRCLATFNNREQQDYRRIRGPNIAAEKLARHMFYCGTNEPARIILPEPGAVECFRMHSAMVKHPAYIVADFEAFLQPLSNCEPNPETSSTIPFQIH